MLKTEAICPACEKHYIVVDTEDSPPLFCPFCAVPINGVFDEFEEEDDE